MQTCRAFFWAAIEATEESIYNSLCMAETMIGVRGATVVALPFSCVENK
jgi:D-aminopeptidase